MFLLAVGLVIITFFSPSSFGKGVSLGVISGCVLFILVIRFLAQAGRLQKDMRGLDSMMSSWRAGGADLGNLGNAYASLGEARRAIEYHKQALGIARESSAASAQGSPEWTNARARRGCSFKQPR
jgi:tetratricopeptide (TPR) repeat protein